VGVGLVAVVRAVGAGEPDAELLAPELAVTEEPAGLVGGGVIGVIGVIGVLGLDAAAEVAGALTVPFA
jgi:hypothetical protein